MQRVTLPCARERAALALACALHAAAFFGLWGWALTHHYWTIVSIQRALEDEIELTLEPSSQPLHPLTSTSVAVGSPQHPGQHVPHANNRLGSAEAVHDAAISNAPDEAASLESAASPSAEASAARVDLGVGEGAWRSWLRSPVVGAADQTGSSSGAERPSPKPASSSGGLQEGLEAHDRELGLGASGPAITALFRAAHDPVAPMTGVAHFRVTVLKSGDVDVSLEDATDQLPAWRAVAKKAAQALKRAPPRILEPRSGARMQIEISAEEVFPNGVKQRELYGPRLEAKAPQFRSVTEQQARLKDLNPLAGQPGELQPLANTKANVDMPGIFVGGKNKVCGYRAGVTPLGPLLQGGCDLSNLGSKPQRMVHTRVREESYF